MMRPRLQTVFADVGRQAELEDWTAEELDLVLQITSGLAGHGTFVVLPKRWIVERTFPGLTHYRRLRNEYATTVTSSVGWIYEQTPRGGCDKASRNQPASARA